MRLLHEICTFFFFLNVQFPKTGSVNSFSSQGITRSDDLNALFGKSPKNDPQSLSLEFKSVANPEPFADNVESTSLEDSDDLQSSDISFDLLETSKHDKHEGNEVVDTEDSDYIETGKKHRKHNEPFKKTSVENNMYMKDFKTGKATNSSNNVNPSHERQVDHQEIKGQFLNARTFSREKSQENGNFNFDEEEGEHGYKPHEDITKMTLHSILLHPEEGVFDSGIAREVNMLPKLLEDKSDAGKTVSVIDNKEIVGKVTRDGQFGNEKTTDELKKTFSPYAGSKKYFVDRGGPTRDPKRIKRGSFNDSQISGEPEMRSSGHDANGESGPVQSFSEKIRPIGEAAEKQEMQKGTKSFDPVLLLEVRKIRMNVLRAERQAINDLNDVRKNFRLKMEDLMEDVKMVRKLTRNVHRKVGLTVNQALAMARQAKNNATNRLYMARKAAKALNNIEKRLGVIHTRNGSKILRSRIPEYSRLNDAHLYKQLLATNKILTKLDGAKELAIYRAEKRFRDEEKTGSSIAKEVDSLRNKLASAEGELSKETEAEIEDERKAQEKIDEAIRRNKLVVKKATFSLSAIEAYLQKLRSDEKKLNQLKFY
ncbi:uncharacterized protein [Montipora foliosa]|uniref:uncharacterized protein n=1 Tax=Montipora foliosa TaxID=591990 RepID=UPI0035F1740F